MGAEGGDGASNLGYEVGSLVVFSLGDLGPEVLFAEGILFRALQGPCNCLGGKFSY